MKLNNTDKTNFGWNVFTHRKITEIALKQIPELSEYRADLMKYSMMPDLDESRPVILGKFTRSNHEYGGEIGDTPTKCYKLHVAEMLKAIKNKNKPLAVEHAGRALHFLQDMAQRQHITVWGKLKEFLYFPCHHAFEFFAHSVLKTKFSDYHPKINSPVRTFNEMIYSNINASKSIERPRMLKPSSWEKIAENTLANALDSSSEFLTKLGKLLKSDI